MRIAYNPKTSAALTAAPSNNDITFDLSGMAIYARGVKFDGKAYNVFKKHASGNTGGYDGLVPAPSYNNNSKNRFLKEDGTWDTTNTLTWKDDVRATSTIPKDYLNSFTFIGIKNSSAIGLPTTDTFVNLIGWKGYLDNTGPLACELASGLNRISVRFGAYEEWGNWNTLAYLSDINVMVGATASTAGKAGLVPVPGAGKNTSFLRGDGTWAVPLDTKVTSADNHYSPSTDTNYTLNKDASSTTAATWGTTSLVTGVTLSRDSKGHVTGLSIDSIKLPSVSNTWRAIQVNDTLIAGTGIDTYALNFVQGTGIIIKGEAGTSSSVNKITITNSGVPISAYSYTSGYLVETDIATESNTMITFRIEGNSYGYDSILTTGQFYNYKDTDSILNASAIHHGYDFGNIIVFCYNNLVHLWFAQQNNYLSFVVYVYGTNVNTRGVNRVTSITNSALPTSGVTRKVTIIPAKRGYIGTTPVLSSAKAQSLSGIIDISATGNYTSTVSTSTDLYVKLANKDAAIGLRANSGKVRGVYDYGKLKWLVYSDGTDGAVLLGHVNTSSTWSKSSGGTGAGIKILNTVGSSPTGALASYSIGLEVSGYYSLLLASQADVSDTLYFKGALSTGWIGILHAGNSSVSGGGSTWGSNITVKINGESKTLTIPSNPNTWRPITDEYDITSPSSTTSLSQTGAKSLQRNVRSFKRFEGTATNGGYDLNTLTEGMVYNYGSTNYWKNGPSGMSYGRVLNLKDGSGGSIAGLLAWDTNHGSTTDTTRYLWWRVSDDGTFTEAKWHRLAYIDDIPSLSLGTTTGTGNAVTSISVSGHTITLNKGATFSLSGHTHSYLPLTGGTLYNASNMNPLSINSASGESGIKFLIAFANKGWIGYNASYGVGIYNYTRGKYLNYKDDGTLLFEDNNVLHSGNSSVSGGGNSGGSSITVNIGGTSKTLTIPTSLPANKLNSANLKSTSGLHYYYAGGITTSTDNTGKYVGPNSSTTYSSILRLQSHITEGLLYYRDLIFDVNGDSIWSRRVTNSGTPTLTSILHSGNSEVSGGGSTWGSSITVKINGTEKTLTIPSAPTIPTLYTRNICINNNDWTVYSTVSTDSTRIYAPTSAGTSGYVLKSNGSGAPSWINPSGLSVSYAELAGSATTAGTAYGLFNSFTVFGVSFNGAITTAVDMSTLIGVMGTGDSDITDSTHILTSHILGFNSSGNTTTIYKRTADHLWNYIKGKIDSTYTHGASGGYIGTTAVLASKTAGQNVTGIGDLDMSGKLRITGTTSSSDISMTFIKGTSSDGYYDYKIGNFTDSASTAGFGIAMTNSNGTFTKFMRCIADTSYNMTEVNFKPIVSTQTFKALATVNSSTVYCNFHVNNSGTSVIENSSGAFYINSKNLISLKANLGNTDTTKQYQIVFNTDGTFYPSSNTISLGRSSNPWNNLYANNYYVRGSVGNTTAFISSDAIYNIYLSVGNKDLLVCNSNEGSVRGSASLAGDTTLGTTNYPWKAVYSKLLFLKSSNYTNTINPASGNYTYLFPSVGGTLLVDTLGVLCKGWTKLTFSYDSTNSNYEERVYSTSRERGGDSIFNTGNGGLIYYELFDLVGILLYLPSLTNIMYWGFTDNGTIVFLPNCSYGVAGNKGLRVYCKNYSGTVLTSGSGTLFFIKF